MSCTSECSSNSCDCSECSRNAPVLEPEDESAGQTGVINRLKSFFELFREHRSQQNALATSYVLLLMHGVHILWMSKQLNVGQYHMADIVYVPYYAGVVNGLFAGAFACFRIRMRVIYVIGASTLAASGFLIIIFHWFRFRNILAMGRFLAGTTYGLTFITLIVHIGGVAAPEFHDAFVAAIGILHCTSLATGASYMLTKYSNVHSHIIVGLMTFVHTILVLFGNPFAIGDSPVALLWTSGTYLLEDTDRPLRTFTALQSDNLAEDEVNRRFLALQQYVDEQKLRSQSALREGNVKLLLIAIGGRVLNASGWMMFLGNFVQESSKRGYSMAFLEWLLLGTAVWMLTVQHKCYVYVGMIFSLSFHLCFRLQNLEVLRNTATRTINAGFVFVLVWLFVMPLEMFSLNYLCGAFSLSKKAWSIAVVLAIEQIVYGIFFKYFFTFRHD